MAEAAVPPPPPPPPPPPRFGIVPDAPDDIPIGILEMLLQLLTSLRDRLRSRSAYLDEAADNLTHLARASCIGESTAIAHTADELKDIMSGIVASGGDGRCSTSLLHLIAALEPEGHVQCATDAIKESVLDLDALIRHLKNMLKQAQEDGAGSSRKRGKSNCVDLS